MDVSEKDAFSDPRASAYYRAYSKTSEKGTTYRGVRPFTRTPGPEPGPDCLMCAEFSRQQISEPSHSNTRKVLNVEDIGTHKTVGQILALA